MNWNRKGFYLGLLGVSGTLFVAPVRLGVVCGNSMHPTLKHGELYLLHRRDYRSRQPRRGEVLVFRYGKETYVKRVLATPGDTVYAVRSVHAESPRVELVMDWQLSRYQKLARKADWNRINRLVQWRIPEGSIFVIGDNVTESVDSREFGPIPVESVLGTIPNAPPARKAIRRIAGFYPSGVRG